VTEAARSDSKSPPRSLHSCFKVASGPGEGGRDRATPRWLLRSTPRGSWCVSPTRYLRRSTMNGLESAATACAPRWIFAGVSSAPSARTLNDTREAQFATKSMPSV